MKQRKPLSPSFVVTLAAGAVALAAGGCSTEVTDSTTNPPVVECPAAQPAAGDACEEGSLVCDYPGADDCETITATCGDAGWEVESADTCLCPTEKPADGAECPSGIEPCVYPGSPTWTATCTEGGWVLTAPPTYEPPACNPPPVCPAELPAPGDWCTCTGFGDACSYQDECGEPIEVWCNGFSRWELTPTAMCNPSPACETLGQDDCALAPACIWHTPGCGDDEVPALPQAGCFPVTGCKSDADCTAGTCEGVMVTPGCADDGCNSCGILIALCLP